MTGMKLFPSRVGQNSTFGGRGPSRVDRRNWKLLQENSAGSYHAATTRPRYFDYLPSREGTRPGLWVSEETPLTGVRDMATAMPVSSPSAQLSGATRTTAGCQAAASQCGDEIDDIVVGVLVRLGEERGRRYQQR